MALLFARLGWVALARAVSAIGSVVLLWAMAKAWSPHQLADYSVVLGCLALLQALSLLGLGFALSRDVAADGAGGVRHARAMLSIAGVAAIVLALVLGLGGELLYSGRLRIAFWATSLCLFATGFTSVFDAQLMGVGRVSAIAAFNAVEAGARLVGFLVVVNAGGGVVDLLLVVALLRWVVASAYLFIPAVRLVLRTRADRKQINAYLQQAPAFCGTVVVGALISRLDLLCLSAMVQPAELGAYALATRLYEMTLIIPVTLTLALFPTIAGLQATGEREFISFVRRMLAWVTGCSIAAGIVAAAAAGPIFAILLPQSYASAIPSIRILLIAAAIAPVSQILASVIIVRRAQNGEIVVLLVALAVLPLTLMLTVPWAGPVGAAIAVFASSLALMLGRLLLCRADVFPGLPPVARIVEERGA